VSSRAPRHFPLVAVVSLASVVSLVSLTPRRAWADTTTKVADGVTLITKTVAGPNVLRTLEVDLTAPGVHLGSTTSAQRGRTTSSFAKTNTQIAAATNGDFFRYADYSTFGLAAGGGAKWSDTQDTEFEGNLAFDGAKRVELHRPAEMLTFDPTWMKGVVSGKPQLVRAGTAGTNYPDAVLCGARHPRTAVGLSADGKKLYLAVVDGRSTASVGMTCVELAATMKSLGAHEALNLDGGGSSTMYLRGRGVVNRPSDGSERVVANHLGIFAPRLGSVATIHGKVHAASDAAKVLPGATVSIAGIGADTSDDSGLYELEALPGKTNVVAKKPGYASKQLSVDVVAGGDIKLDIGLTPDPTADFDEDKVLDSEDNCPEIANPDQHDADGDGQGDACEMDDDGDGVADEDDNCPLVANADQQDGDEDGVGDACPAGASADPSKPGTVGDRSEDAASGEDAGDGGCASGGRTPCSGALVVGVGLAMAAAARRRRLRR
jgi:hypothetical protein